MSFGIGGGYEMKQKMTLEEIIQGSVVKPDGVSINPRIQIGNSKDTVSIQTGRYLYCTPREDRGPYIAVELGFPTCVPPDYILDYAEDSGDPTETVYGYVPVDLVRRWFRENTK